MINVSNYWSEGRRSKLTSFCGVSIRFIQMEQYTRDMPIDVATVTSATSSKDPYGHLTIKKLISNLFAILFIVLSMLYVTWFCWDTVRLSSSQNLSPALQGSSYLVWSRICSYLLYSWIHLILILDWLFSLDKVDCFGGGLSVQSGTLCFFCWIS